MKTELQNYKEIHKFTADQKLKFWGYGEWVEEPDEVTFTHKDIDCKVIRIFARENVIDFHMYGGYLCGYVRVPEKHPAYEKGYDDIDIEVHGGLTFSQQIKEQDSHLSPGYWIGFDCAHMNDYTPSIEYLKRTMPELMKIEEDVKRRFPNLPKWPVSYKNINFCIEECKSMAEQIMKMERINS